MQYIKQELTEFTSTNLTDSYPDWSPTTTYIVEPDNALKKKKKPIFDKSDSID